MQESLVLASAGGSGESLIESSSTAQPAVKSVLASNKMTKLQASESA
jgi:hypothetical protein